MVNTLCTAFFRSKNLIEISWYGTSHVARSLVEYLIDIQAIDDSATLADACDSAYGRLLKTTRPEYIYKNILLSKTVFGTYSPTTSSWLYEFRIGEARSDAVLINSVATVYEIKTDLDDFSRAKDQLSAYYRSFDRVIFVVGPSQVKKAVSILPSHVGILMLSNRQQLSVIREAIDYKEELSSEAIFHLLRKGEREILEKKFLINTAQLAPINRYAAALDAFSKLSPVDIHASFIEVLRKREPATKRAAIANSLPASLRAAVFSYKMKKNDWKHLASHLKEPAIKVLEL